MDPSLSPAWTAALFLPVVLLMAIAITVERRQSRRNRADGVLVTFDDLRLTARHLLIGPRDDAVRIPLDGLSARVEFTGSPRDPDDNRVHLTIENAGTDIRRSQRYAYGSSERAQVFAMRVNMLSSRTRAGVVADASFASLEEYRRAA